MDRLRGNAVPVARLFDSLSRDGSPDVNDSFVIGLVSVAVLGGAAQWLGWRLRLPAILLLLVFGVAAGPEGLGLVRTDEMFGELLLPFVAVAVAILLFEGALNLHVPELGDRFGVVARLVTLGAAVTWAMAGLAGRFVLDLSWPLAVLVGAILTVTGPTVVLPLLRQIRPTGPGGVVLKWEGILIDPVGAVLAVLVFEALLDGGVGTAVVGIGTTIVAGSVFGGLAAWLLVACLARYWIPDHLHSATALGLALLCYALANQFQHEAGLLAVTVMGVILANQRRVDIGHITEFKENLQVLLISALFILLAARIRLTDVQQIGGKEVLFLGLLVLVIRPVVVAICTRRSRLSTRDRVFLAAMAPRGVVAAAVTAVFALRLEAEGFVGAERLVPIVFFVIAGSVAIYGLGGRPLAIRLGLAQRSPSGVLMIGAHGFSRSLASELQKLGVPVMVVDTNARLVDAAREEGLPAYHGTVLSDMADEELDLPGIGMLFAMTPNDEVNALSARHYLHLFGRRNLYQLAPDSRTRDGSAALGEELRARLLFGDDASHLELSNRFRTGARVTATRMTEDSGFTDWQRVHGSEALPLVVVSQKGDVSVGTVDSRIEPKAGDTLLGLTFPAPDPAPR